MDIKILGTGCEKCKTTQEIVEKVVNDMNVDATVTKVDDFVEIMKFNVALMPAVVVDGVVKIKGRVPSEDEVRKAIEL